ncbi:hypothetical protein G7077_00435 [Sphingomonas piscis]|uniref:Uracil-DNA glycosylase-like domain-containing protein n=1 Tax=Sphingomonas piscis TaxID=2714943 RepID=A0A6G7YLJ6_9SPHN|nr:uracil-DNA glycosylase family protein [Sphingomonas piscis]QIK77614.1 hypothetical protein G7077_00435 [Sphingomonas piscis]
MGGDDDHAEVAELRSALSWWLESGVDAATVDEPQDRLKPPSQRLPAAAPTVIEELPDNLELFRAWLREAQDVPFAGTGPRVLPAGPEQPAIMLITDMAAADSGSDQGPVAGDSWQLTQRMLRSVGIAAEQTYRASLSCFHHVAGLPKSKDLDACVTIARRHIGLVKPQRLLLLGDGAAMALLGKKVAAARGHVQKVEGVRTVATFHPTFLMNQPSQKDAAWADLLLLTEE